MGHGRSGSRWGWPSTRAASTRWRRSSERPKDAGLGLDEIALAREFDSRDNHEMMLLRFVKALLETDGAPPVHILEEARESGWTDEQVLEAVAHVALASFGNLVTRAADLPVDGSPEGSRLLQAA